MCVFLILCGPAGQSESLSGWLYWTHFCILDMAQYKGPWKLRDIYSASVDMDATETLCDVAALHAPESGRYLAGSMPAALETLRRYLETAVYREGTVHFGAVDVARPDAETRTVAIDGSRFTATVTLSGKALFEASVGGETEELKPTLDDIVEMHSPDVVLRVRGMPCTTTLTFHAMVGSGASAA